jgi:hypothetical protein
MPTAPADQKSTTGSAVVESAGSAPTTPSNPRIESHKGTSTSSRAVVPASTAAGAGAVAFPRGGAVSVANQFRNNPGAMHDVDFYQSVAAELPDSKVLHSILYTHRSVADEGPTVDEELASISENAHNWENTKSAQVKELQEIKKANLTEEYEQDKKDEEAKVLEHSRIFQRLEEMTTELDSNIEKSFDLESQELKQQRQNMEVSKQKRKLALDQRLAEQEEEALKLQLQRSKIEELAGLARTEMEELLHRGLEKTAEERCRIDIAFDKANEAQRIGLWLERLEWSQKLETQEGREAAYIHQWIADTNLRVQRLLRLGELKNSMNSNLMMSEQGARQNHFAAEAVTRIKLAEEYSQWLNNNRVGVSPKRDGGSPTRGFDSSIRTNATSNSAASPHSSSVNANPVMSLHQVGQRASFSEDADGESPNGRASALSTPALHDATSPPGSPMGRSQEEK